MPKQKKIYFYIRMSMTRPIKEIYPKLVAPFQKSGGIDLCII